MLKRTTILLLSLATCLLADRFTISYIEDKPRSLMKDFYISNILDRDISSKDARELLDGVFNLNRRLFYKFANKIDEYGFKRTLYCLKLKPKEFEGKEADCIAMGLNLYKATEIEPKKLLKIADDIDKFYPKLAKKYRLIASREFSKIIDTDNRTLISIFNSVGSKYRSKYLNHKLPTKRVLTLMSDPNFSQMVIKIVREKSLENLQNSILKIDSSNLSSQANFLLALNAVKLNKEDIAIWYLKVAKKSAKLQEDRDKILFWLYLLTKKDQYLSKLIESKSINIYTIYAYETLKIEPKGVIKEINPKADKAPFNVQDPFEWIEVKNSFKSREFKSYKKKREAALKLNSKDTEPHVSELIYKFSLNEHYFLMPNFRYISNLPKKRAALILAIAKQESKFIPTAISYSYALGLMQFMPYVAKDIAKKHGFKNFKYEDMFDPKIAYRFADIHLDFLEKELNHPIFIAYAYNGGIGFLKRRVLQKGYFKEGKYEPFISMELMPNRESREYGKKVLANYLIYSKLLGEKLSIKDLFQTLKVSPHNTHF